MRDSFQELFSPLSHFAASGQPLTEYATLDHVMSWWILLNYVFCDQAYMYDLRATRALFLKPLEVAWYRRHV